MDEVTEVVGRSGSGKTQLAFTVAAMAALAGHHVLFVDTTNGFSGSRMLEILKARSGHVADPPAVAAAALSCIRVVSVFDIFAALEVVEHAISSTLLLGTAPQGESADEQGLSLVVIDSVTSLVAPLLGGESRNFSGQSLAGHFAASLHRLASGLLVGVLVTNEARTADEVVSDIVSGSEDPPWTGEDFKPALGRSWGYTANVRLVISSSAPNATTGNPQARTVAITKHTRLATGTSSSIARVRVDQGGVS